MTYQALVVDPHPKRCELYRSLLATMGLSALCLRDGLDAYRFLRGDHSIEILVTELSLPRIDGFDLLRCLQELPPSPMRVLVISAFREMRVEASRQRLELGISAILTPLSTVEAFHATVTSLRKGYEGPFEAAPIPIRPPGSSANEARRLASIEAHRLTHDLPDDRELRAILDRTVTMFQVPLAMVSLVLEDCQWIKAAHGAEPHGETPLDSSFCRRVVEAEETMIIPDASAHPVFASNRFVKANQVRGYAGAPLIGSDGYVWGTLCVVDPQAPLKMTPEELTQLSLLARLVVVELERGQRSESRGASIVSKRLLAAQTATTMPVPAIVRSRSSV